MDRRHHQPAATDREDQVARVGPPVHGAAACARVRQLAHDKTVTDARKLDIDHVVPLAEAWDSGASKWTSERREKYANDLDADRSLVAVSLGPNRTKGDKDPAEWMPPAKDATCTYATDWVAAKLRWKLTADRTETKALRTIAADCKGSTVSFTPAP
ncbi:HNH endonuclease family protein [Streptomyces lydicus]|uniref:HNH endonuclease family protein n=1 Tax=Streptomyces lydicus TaxID=47763 RepID=UPI003791E9A7